MDTAYPEVPVKLMNHFHAMDRELYSILVFVLERDPKVSVIIIALWIWLEHNKINCAVQKILSSSSIKLINGLADEAVACLRCITDAMYLFSSDASEVSLTQKVLGKKLSLNFFHENRAKALDWIRVIVEDVCVKELGDLMNLAMQQRFGGLKFTGESSQSVVPPMDPKIQRFGGLGFTGESSESVMPPLLMDEPKEKKKNVCYFF
ncbi:uncharacterized protein LOC116021118 [Ipomoea triloba]|uniref:uncharacterized protein LOC116021118 n=1 Tax=Ipomoea triloba TaxID=35885 RepID=UPI00125E8D45|nr:uncharacterized protein LOC116021118 [Ipomoea triloba]XP_031117589.1 uncharacterized protein LOC116021118 [Ipomoea triloba]XP_031117590.1 uncharacterized protein LOC116021118 [Ipomoea triloba]